MAHDIAEILAAGCVESRRLLEILEEEFEALRSQTLDEFERLQTLKAEIFFTLNSFVETLTAAREQAHETGMVNDPAWISFQALMVECREAHLRNDILIRSKLEAIRSSLSLLQNSANAASVELYDRLGRVSGNARGRGYTDA